MATLFVSLVVQSHDPLSTLPGDNSRSLHELIVLSESLVNSNALSTILNHNNPPWQCIIIYLQNTMIFHRPLEFHYLKNNSEVHQSLKP